ncbi:glycosyltransferase family 4 protein [Calothrix sp. PCC 7507]|uniref:glycosyltransferase family 4 protein n=1 Tax=Calothrix sp. PCC 7507 TaxID=99598 RepID=UPI00029F1E05|nr:glycosyltransferase family 4 protein [Calothrix sp. PCC 7507]AFY30875.1 glycosyl transferase group 1 [Calothrix sp. PCC 7507]
MKFLILLPSESRGGAEEYALTIAQAAVKKGWEVYTAFSQVDENSSLVRDLIANKVNVCSLKIGESGHANSNLQDILRAIWTIIFLLKLKPDVVQIVLPAPEHAFGSILACGLLKVPTTVVFQLPLPRNFTNKSLRAYTWARNRHQKWIVISENARKVIANSFQIPGDELLCIYNGASLISHDYNKNDVFVKDIKKQLCAELKIPDNSRLALTIGRLDFQKGHEYLINAIPHLIQDFPDLRFIWAGDGSQRQYLENLLYEYKVQDRVFLLGYRSDVAALLKASDIFIFPTRFEGLPFALLEAMANGLPIVTSDASGIPEVIEHHVHGLLFRTGDSCDLLESVRWALRHPTEMDEMGRNAQIRVKDFSEDRMIVQTLDVLEKLARRL